MNSSITMDPAWAGDAPIPAPKLLQEPKEGTWPRMLVLDEDTKARLVKFLDHEISLCWQERSVLVEDWIRWQKDYWAKPAQTVKNFPFRRAANIVIPMTAIAVEAIYARLLTTLFSVKPFYSIRPRSIDWIRHAPHIESWFQTEVEDASSIDMDGFARESLLELIKLGTGVGKTGYERDIRKVNVDTQGSGSFSKWVTRRDGATLDYVPLANFLLRLHEKDPQKAVWVGEEHTDVSWVQLKRLGLSGRMYQEAIKEVRVSFGTTPSSESTAEKYDADRRMNEGDEPAWHESISFCEVWISFDVDGDGVDEEIVVDFHKDSGTILSARYNWYDDIHRPYQIGVYVPVEGRWAGLGAGKQLEQFQALITTIHRQRLDAGTLANMSQLALKKTSGYGPDEPIWPGKIWFVDNPQTDVNEFSLSNLQHFAQLSNEDSARNYADKRSGVNELILGTPTVGTPPTATSDLTKLAEGNKKFDMILKNVRRWYSLLGLDILANYQQFGSRDRTWLARGEKGEFVEQFLQMPQQNIRAGLYLELTVTDSITNKDIEQQKWLNLFQVLSMHYDKVLERAGQVAGLLQDPAIFLMFSELALKASNEAMTRLLGAYMVPDTESFLIDLDRIGEGDAGSQEGGGAEPGIAGGGEGAAGATGGAESPQGPGASGLGGLFGGLVSIEEG